MDNFAIMFWPNHLVKMLHFEYLLYLSVDTLIVSQIVDTVADKTIACFTDK